MRRLRETVTAGGDQSSITSRSKMLKGGAKNRQRKTLAVTEHVKSAFIYPLAIATNNLKIKQPAGATAPASTRGAKMRNMLVLWQRVHGLTNPQAAEVLLLHISMIGGMRSGVKKISPRTLRLMEIYTREKLSPFEDAT